MSHPINNYGISKMDYVDPNKKAGFGGGNSVSTAQIDTSDPEVSDSREKVRSLNGDITWVLYTYVGTSEKLKVQSTGNGGISELVGELNDGKQMFGFMRVTLESSGTPKFVYFSYNGSSVPPQLKGLMHGRSFQMSQWLQPFHMQVDATREDDIDEEKILKKLAASANK